MGLDVRLDVLMSQFFVEHARHSARTLKDATVPWVPMYGQQQWWTYNFCPPQRSNLFLKVDILSGKNWTYAADCARQPYICSMKILIRFHIHALIKIILIKRFATSWTKLQHKKLWMMQKNLDSLVTMHCSQRSIPLCK